LDQIFLKPAERPREIVCFLSEPLGDSALRGPQDTGHLPIQTIQKKLFLGEAQGLGITSQGIDLVDNVAKVLIGGQSLFDPPRPPHLERRNEQPFDQVLRPEL
jgi:hypothetical protein